jgi:hypothetical protein
LRAPGEGRGCHGVRGLLETYRSGVPGRSLSCGTVRRRSSGAGPAGTGPCPCVRSARRVSRVRMSACGPAGAATSLDRAPLLLVDNRAFPPRYRLRPRERIRTDRRDLPGRRTGPGGHHCWVECSEVEWNPPPEGARSGCAAVGAVVAEQAGLPGDRRVRRGRGSAGTGCITRAGGRC